LRSTPCVDGAEKGKDLRSLLGVLGTYVGHVDLAATKTDLAVTPERLLNQLLAWVQQSHILVDLFDLRERKWEEFYAN
jgi:hypothetical protein